MHRDRILHVSINSFRCIAMPYWPAISKHIDECDPCRVAVTRRMPSMKESKHRQRRARGTCLRAITTPQSYSSPILVQCLLSSPTHTAGSNTLFTTSPLAMTQHPGSTVWWQRRTWRPQSVSLSPVSTIPVRILRCRSRRSTSAPTGASGGMRYSRRSVPSKAWTPTSLNPMICRYASVHR
ncbi:hypothetical protein PENSPDRAFT_362623 [Peniophora sp. CONT]|nr:hypothetical protein PENSPDRAFT_362623 [Peniophora sp. CONT]